MPLKDGYGLSGAIESDGYAPLPRALAKVVWLDEFLLGFGRYEQLCPDGGAGGSRRAEDESQRSTSP